VQRCATLCTFRLKEEPCSDYCVHLWCSPCAVCQEVRVTVTLTVACLTHDRPDACTTAFPAVKC
jgi:hypothetical protein